MNERRNTRSSLSLQETEFAQVHTSSRFPNGSFQVQRTASPGSRARRSSATSLKITHHKSLRAQHLMSVCTQYSLNTLHAKKKGRRRLCFIDQRCTTFLGQGPQHIIFSPLEGRRQNHELNLRVKYKNTDFILKFNYTFLLLVV